MKKRTTKKSSEQIDRDFDSGKSVLEMGKQGGQVLIKRTTQKVNINFPTWMIEALDSESEKLAIDRQAVIKTMINQALESRGYSAFKSDGYKDSGA